MGGGDWLLHVVLQLADLVLEGKAEALDCREGLEGVEGDQSRVELGRFVLGYRVEVYQAEDLVDHGEGQANLGHPVFIVGAHAVGGTQ